MEIRARYLLIGLFVVAAIAAGFGFIYWLNTTGGLGERSSYRIRFDGPTAGLLRGAAVLFNGLKVGEVTDLALDPTAPKVVIATVSVDARTPVRADTTVGLDYRGLTGVPSVSLTGGSNDGAAVTPGADGPIQLAADTGASQDVMTAARIAVQHFDEILTENSEPLKNTIANLETFSDALARNSDRIDKIADGLANLLGGDKDKEAPGNFALTAPASFPVLDTPPEGELVVADPTGVILFDSQRVIVEGADGAAKPEFEKVRWRDTLPVLIQQTVVRAFENAGFLKASRPADALTANFQLVLDIREFTVVTTPKPMARVELGARILDENGDILGSKVFKAEAEPTTLDGLPAAQALDKAFGAVVSDMIAWTFQTI